MDKQIKEHSSRKLVTQRNTFLVLFCMQIVAVTTLSVLLTKKDQKIVVVPTNGPTFWLDGQSVSTSYLEGMGRYLSELLLSRSAEDHEWKDRSLFPHIHPSLLPKLRSTLREDCERLQKTQQTYAFSHTIYEADPENMRVIIEGEMRTFLNHSEQEETKFIEAKKRRYIFDFAYEGGRLLLQNINKETIS